jgi:hypothetical protein
VLETLPDVSVRPIDVRDAYVNGYRDGLKKAAELLVKMSRDSYVECGDPEELMVTRTLARSGGKIRRLLREVE